MALTTLPCATALACDMQIESRLRQLVAAVASGVASGA
jgi:hypothetical protein